MSEQLEGAPETSPRAATYKPLGNDLFQLILTRENKAEIFEYALSKLDEGEREASTILENLARWDPHTAGLFTLRSSSTILSTPFRLIFPSSDLSSFEESGLYVRQYVAVSYCWRSEEFLLEGYERYGDWPISKPFVDAILEDKRHPRQGIWMDQLCIDQASAVDKQKSVAAMDVIYRSCIRLLVLLEEVYLDEQEAALPEKYDPSKKKTKYERAWVPPEDEWGAFASFYHKVNAARWWERAWCFHEFSVNEPWTDKRQCNEIHNATFVVNGPKGSTVKIKWYTLHYIMVVALQTFPDLVSSVVTDAKGQAIFTAMDTAERVPGWRGSLMARYNGVARKGCLYLEDRLSVMINMCGLGLAYHGHSLRTTDEVLYLSALLALAAGEPYPLTMFHGTTSVKLTDRRTWLQRHVAADDTSIPKFKLGGLRGIHRISKQEIELDVVFLQPPAAWQLAQEAELRLTYQIFPETIATTRPGTHGPVGESYTFGCKSDAEIDNSRRSFLASCITNGYSFTERLWAQLKTDVVGPNYNQGLFKDLAPNPTLHVAARRLIAQLLPTSMLLSIPPPATFSFEDAQLFLTWLTDPRSMYYISTSTYRLQCTADGQRGFATTTHVNKHFRDGPVEELRAAVPTALVGESCIPLRVWLLRPGKGDDGADIWRLVGKSILLGEPDLMGEARGSEGSKGAVLQLGRAVVGG
ncbi:uncharacterized protein EKO05_0007149 [Ascochyta rabiei]|uniref:uncharacterized protein n=1 Tax=Didymella rabiei TaxID=5454 RepID=UPI0018FFF8D7|nr:uncharacterized protein EKO05_0007149 [Ascochyta rabiei]UPX16763.1 hypothetical protein EKO05_0007149 [Ascochyta rabiei]